jgi:hypothetical protein
MLYLCGEKLLSSQVRERKAVCVPLDGHPRLTIQPDV